MNSGFDNFGDELSNIIDGTFSQNSTEDLNEKEIEIADDKREQILSKVDVKDMTQEECKNRSYSDSKSEHVRTLYRN